MHGSGDDLMPSRRHQSLVRLLTEGRGVLSAVLAFVGLDVVALQHGADAPLPPGLSLDALRDAAVARLDADHRVVESARPAADGFAPTEPIGAAKRDKSHIYGHSCGGFFVWFAECDVSRRTSWSQMVSGY